MTIERDTLQARYTRQEQQFSTLKAYVDDLSSTLDSIAIQENMLFLPDPETPHIPLTKRQIQRRLDDFHDLILRQHERINYLEETLDSNNADLKNVKTMLTYFKVQIQEKDDEIVRMKAELKSRNENIRELKTQVSTLQSDVELLHADIDTLQQLADKQNQLIAEQSAQLSEGYYIVGTRNQLFTKGVIRNTKVTSNLDLSNFNVVDKRTFTALELPSSKIRVMTNVPEDSYKVLKNADGTAVFSIVDVDKFWSLGNVLVIMLR